jgi:hypothetical protein
MEGLMQVTIAEAAQRLIDKSIRSHTIGVWQEEDSN